MQERVESSRDCSNGKGTVILSRALIVSEYSWMMEKVREVPFSRDICKIWLTFLGESWIEIFFLKMIGVGKLGLRKGYIRRPLGPEDPSTLRAL